jgi:hypothetical protein
MEPIVYPKFLKDIPPWRRRQITQDILWFSKYSPTERLEFVDREWADIQNFIKDYSFLKHGTRRRRKHQQDIEYLLKAKKLRKQ